MCVCVRVRVDACSSPEIFSDVPLLAGLTPVTDKDTISMKEESEEIGEE
jgi:hypothetical protein